MEERMDDCWVEKSSWIAITRVLGFASFWWSIAYFGVTC